MTKFEQKIQQVCKLIELSKSSNQEEAANAAARAAEIMLKYQIEEADLEKSPDNAVKPVKRTVVERTGKIVEWRNTLLWGLSKSMGCEFYYVSGNHRGDEAMYVVIGDEDSARTIEYMYKYLANEVDRLAKDTWNNEGKYDADATARGWKSAFRTGCSQVIFNRLREQRKETFEQARLAGKSTAMMVLDKQHQDVMKYKDSLNLSTGAASTAGSASLSGYLAGRTAGENVNLGGNYCLGQGAEKLGCKQ